MSFHTKINATLAAYVSVINALVAIGIPIVMGLTTGSIAGNAVPGFSIMGFIGGFIAGALVGVLISGAVCGVLAVLIDIRNALRERDLHD